jgi:hypothetical protein
MIKNILLTADIHIKLKQKKIPTDWALNRYTLFKEQLVSCLKNVDILVIMGDVFDGVPSLEELSVFFDLVEALTIPTYIFDGNHEATKKGKTFLGNIAKVTSIINSKVNIITEVTEYEWGTLLPYCCLFRKDVIKGLNTNKPLFSHFRGDIPPHVKAEIDLSLFKDFPVVFAGDLHSTSNSQLNIVYPGSPMTTCFHRSKVETGMLKVFYPELKITWIPLNLPQLIRKTVQNPNEMVPTFPDHTIYEIEGDLSELAIVENSELLDKKVVKRNNESALILTKDMTIEEELFEYLCYILELPETTAQEVITEFHDNI